MYAGDPLTELLKFVVLLAVAPALATAAVYLLCQVFTLLLPVLILLVVIFGIVSGLSAGLILRRRLGSPHTPPADVMPPPPEPIRRPRAPGRRET